MNKSIKSLLNKTLRNLIKKSHTKSNKTAKKGGYIIKQIDPTSGYVKKPNKKHNKTSVNNKKYSTSTKAKSSPIYKSSSGLLSFQLNK